MSSMVEAAVMTAVVDVVALSVAVVAVDWTVVVVDSTAMVSVVGGRAYHSGVGILGWSGASDVAESRFMPWAMFE